MKNYISIFLIALMGLAVFTGCKKGCTDPSATNFDEDARNDDGTCEYEVYGDVALDIHHLVGTDNFAFNQEYTSADGRAFTFTTAKMYLSNFKLENAAGAMEEIEDSYILVDPSEDNYSLGTAFADGYTGLSFHVGIDSLTNHMDPTTYAADNPLAPQTPSMHWSWNAGYIFFMIEGTMDTTANMTGTATDGTWYFHPGTDALLRTVDVSKTFEVTESGYTFHADLDWGALLTDVDLRTENSSHTMNDFPLAEKVANNATSAFSFDH